MDAEKIFLEYANRYDRSNTKIELKIVHTLQVVKIMDRLTAQLGLSEEERELSHVIAMFHDIGRFEQIVRYNTFFDFLSVDHAQLGIEVLKKENLLQEFSKEKQDIIYTAIANHNQLYIAENVEEEMLLYCKLIRDADKCDIFRVFATEDMLDTVGETIEQIEEELVPQEAYESIFLHTCVKRGKNQNGLNRWLTFLGFFFDMNYDESVEFLMKDKYYRYQFDHAHFKNEETRKKIAEILEEMERYIQSRLVRLQEKRNQ